MAKHNLFGPLFELGFKLARPEGPTDYNFSLLPPEDGSRINFRNVAASITPTLCTDYRLDDRDLLPGRGKGFVL
jgi:hypothetical protein